MCICWFSIYITAHVSIFGTIRWNKNTNLLVLKLLDFKSLRDNGLPINIFSQLSNNYYLEENCWKKMPIITVFNRLIEIFVMKFYDFFFILIRWIWNFLLKMFGSHSYANTHKHIFIMYFSFINIFFDLCLFVYSFFLFDNKQLYRFSSIVQCLILDYIEIFREGERKGVPINIALCLKKADKNE